MAPKVVKRKSTGAWTISGTVNGIRVQKRAQSNNKRVAEEEAAQLEARMLREDWHGPRPRSRTIYDAMRSYVDAVPRRPRTVQRLNRLLAVIRNDAPLTAIDQDVPTQLRDRLLKPSASPATFTREIGTPLISVMKYAARQGWCPEPRLILPRTSQGRTIFLMPAQTERLVAAASDRLKPLVIFLLGTGARAGEALALEWPDVDLVGRRAIFWQTKSGKRRNVELPSRVVAALAELPHREGRVFRHRRGAYADRPLGSGGQFKRAWTVAIQGAGLDPMFTPHVLRHTWATWHYALNKDLLALKVEGGWANVAMVERYAKLMPAGYEAEIRRFLDDECNRSVTDLGHRLPLSVSSP